MENRFGASKEAGSEIVALEDTSEGKEHEEDAEDGEYSAVARGVLRILDSFGGGGRPH